MTSFENLSEREKVVFELLLQGKSNKQIAFELEVTSRTIEFHLSNIYAKLGVGSRSEAILLAAGSGYHPSEKSSGTGIRESTVVFPSRKEDNSENPVSAVEIPLRKKTFLFAGIVMVLVGSILAYYFLNQANNKLVLLPGEETIEQPVFSSQTPTSLITAVDAENTLTQTIGAVSVKLSVDWFYIDTGRMYLETTLCGFPVPDGVQPTYLIDPAKISIQQSDDSPVKILTRVNTGGGSGPDDLNQSTGDSPCLVNTFDYKLAEDQTDISQTSDYHITVPVGGSLPDESGKIWQLPSANFQFSLRPTYAGSLTFSTDKSGEIEGKKISFNGAEINPKSAAVILCVFDPNGEQWLPDVDLIYQGNIIFPTNVGLLDGSNGDPQQPMCYRIHYAGSFAIQPANDPWKGMSVLVTKLTQDQPERLPGELIAQAQNDLAAQDIAFNYVIVNHGVNIVITQKPENLTDAEVFAKIHRALQEEAFASSAMIFNLE